jgi:hypothetical protein
LPKLTAFFKKCPKQTVEYYHIETADYTTNWIIANNLVVETYSDNFADERMRRYELAVKNEDLINKLVNRHNMGIKKKK